MTRLYIARYVTPAASASSRIETFREWRSLHSSVSRWFATAGADVDAIRERNVRARGASCLISSRVLLGIPGELRFFW